MAFLPSAAAGGAQSSLHLLALADGVWQTAAH